MISIDYDEFKNMWHVAVKVQVQVLGYEPVNWTKQTYGTMTYFFCSVPSIQKASSASTLLL